jgi:SAM-dependent methyltransferase
MGEDALITATRFSNARVLAVDLSLSSLSYALRKTNELGFSNIEYAQADIMELGSLGRQFDLIECGGVLHHLGDPLTGWRTLVDLLRPEGLMKIALYSETARQDIVSGRSLIAEKGYTTSPEDIRRCRQDIIAMAGDGNPEMVKICNTGDFFNLSACRDLLFHVQEHRFTLPQIEAALKTLKLKFLGFEMRDQRELSMFRESHPDRGALTSLDLWHTFELDNPDTFRVMYHLWCRKK